MHPIPEMSRKKKSNYSPNLSQQAMNELPNTAWKKKKKAMVCYFHIFMVFYAKHSIMQSVTKHTELYPEDQYTAVLTTELGKASKQK